MFSIQHLIWAAIVLVVVVVAMKYLHKNQVPLEKLRQYIQQETMA